MNIDSDVVRESAKTVSQAGSFVEGAAKAAKGSGSKLGQVATAVSGVRLGARLLPVVARLFRRYPLGAVLVAAGVIWAVYAIRETRTSTRL